VGIIFPLQSTRSKTTHRTASVFLLGIFAVPSIAETRFQGMPETAKRSTTYYVDSRNGDDGRVGTTPEAAWKTLAKVNATTFHPGDRILLKSSSVWQGQLWPKGSGAEGRPITIGMYGGGVKPVINGDGFFEDAVLLKNQEYWEIEDLEVTNNGPQRAERRAVHVALENYGEAHHIYIRSLTVHDVNGVDSVKPNGGINYTSVGGRKPSRFVDLRIENNEIYHVDRSGIFGWSDSWVRSKWFPSLSVLVRGNQLHDIGGDGIVVVATDGAVVEHNVVGHANQRSDGYNVAIWAWSADNYDDSVQRGLRDKRAAGRRRIRFGLEQPEYGHPIQLQPRQRRRLSADLQ
jgi:hypothetical protein